MIFLLSGWSGAGKDTVADFLCLNHGFTKLAFADSLKEIVAKELGIPFELTQTQEGKRSVYTNGKRIRDYLIQRGQEIREEQNNPGYFAEQVARKIGSQGGNYVISDWRFLEEFKIIKEIRTAGKIYTVRITRKGQEESQVKDSITEHSLDFFSFSHRLYNPGTIDGLEKEIQCYIENVMCEKEVVEYENGNKTNSGDNRM